MELQVETTRGHHLLRIEASQMHWTLSDLLRDAHLSLNTRCGQRHHCDGCRVELLAGKLVHVESGQTVSAAQLPVIVRACEYRPSVDAPSKIRIPERSLLSHTPEVLSDYRICVSFAHDPLWRPATGREGEQALGAAIDLGTTTVVVLVVDLESGRVVGKAAGFNRQIELGEDVVTRITLCQVHPEETAMLRAAITQQTLAPLLKTALAQVEGPAGARRVECVTVAGNTTMLHLLVGENPASLGIAPFRPVFLETRRLPGPAVLGDLPETQEATIHLLAGAAAYVGADIVGGMVASGLAFEEGPSLLVDVGTNGEIVLKRGERMLACATAAGPAFEGAGLSCGVRAGEGAVTHVQLEEKPLAIRTRMLGSGEHPIGLCGSAYIDFLAEGRRIGLLNAMGRFDLERCPEARERIVPWTDRDGGPTRAIRIAQGSGGPLVITEADIAHLLTGKAAVAAGILMLLERAGVRPETVERVCLAGGFGTHMSAASAIGCGLLPGFRAEQIEVVGNSALAGAYLALVDGGLMETMQRMAQQVEVVALNREAAFESCYIDQLTLP